MSPVRQPTAADYSGREMSVVQAIDLRRTYRTTTGSLRRRTLEVEAVRGVSFEIAEGELFGLLGPNGAGKTTTIECVIGLRDADAGSIAVCGIDGCPHARRVAVGAHCVDVDLRSHELVVHRPLIEPVAA